MHHFLQLGIIAILRLFEQINDCLFHFGSRNFSNNLGPYYLNRSTRILFRAHRTLHPSYQLRNPQTQTTSNVNLTAANLTDLNPNIFNNHVPNAPQCFTILDPPLNRPQLENSPQVFQTHQIDAT